jgi:arabinose-5-phosphate isomerase
MNNIQNTINQNINSLKYTSSNINFNNLNNIIEFIKNEKCLYFSGIGKNYHIASIIASTFNSLTIRSILFDSVHAVHGDMGLIEDNSKIILISKSGNTDELLFFCKKIKERNCNSKVCLIHSNNNCKLKKYSDIDLYVPILNECDPWNRVPTSSLVAYLTILHSIGMEIINYKNVSIQDFYKNHPGGDIGKQNN